jgi:hypothetical protein
LLFDQAIQNGYASRAVYYERGLLRRSRQDISGATEDFWNALNASDVPVEGRETLFSVQALLDIQPDSVEKIASAWSVVHLPVEDCMQLAMRVDDSVPGLKLIKLVLSRVLEQAPIGIPEREPLQHFLGLALIGLGDFSEALDCLNPNALEATALLQTVAFNAAMAEWGATGSISKSLFSRVVETDKSPTRPGQGPNYSQCLAIANWAVGDTEASARKLAEARRMATEMHSREFSAWRYLKVDPSEFARDLDEIGLLIKGENVLPRFMSRRSPK